MKKLIFLALGLIAFNSIQAQTDVYFNINHKLGSSPFNVSQIATNNLGHAFSVTRLQYYISQIKLVHDGGQVTPVDSTWILADAEEVTNVMLGNFNISSLEAVKFSIGVESPTNHQDPSFWSIFDPLGPKSPAMHWGWASGYRFVAMEGLVNNQTEVFQIHALGDVNYFDLTLNTAGTLSGNTLSLDMDADYAGALKNIDASAGFLEHSEEEEAQKLLINFNRDVFTSVEGNKTVSQQEFTIQQNKIEVYPNPSNGNFTISQSNSQDLKVEIYNAVGTLLTSQSSQGNQLKIHGLNPGLYILNVYANHRLIDTQRVIVIQ